MPLREFIEDDTQTCALTLCRQGSEMQQEFLDRVSSTPVAMVYAGVLPVAWAATHRWRGFQTVEGFTRMAFRRRGCQRFAAAGLVAARFVQPEFPVAVFAPECVALTRSLGFSDVKLFRRSDGGEWVLA